MEINEDSAADVAQVLSRFVNRGMSSAQTAELAAMIRNDHRTLQQRVGSLVFTLIAQWSDDFEAGRYDLRNSDTCRLAKKLADVLKEDRATTVRKTEIRTKWGEEVQCAVVPLPLI